VNGRPLHPTLGGEPKGRRAKLADQVAAALEARILDGTLAPGDRLPIEFALADEFNVSRTVVRDAVRALATRRLVDVRQGLGTVVTMPSPEGYADAALMLLLRSACTLGDLWDARELLDTEMTALAMRSGRADWSEAESALAEYEAAIIEERVDDVEDAHRRFHVGLMTAAHNPVIDLLMAPMHEIIMATSSAGTGQPSLPEELRKHRPILEAAKSGDEGLLRAAVAAHYSYKTQRKYRSRRDQKLRSVLLGNGAE
jgi:GntR family transcriptional repressor for pyruvate dehydrogenase complex